MTHPDLAALDPQQLTALLHTHTSRYHASDPADGLTVRERNALLEGIQARLAEHGIFPDADGAAALGYWPGWVPKSVQGPCPYCGANKVIRRRNDPDLRPATWSCDRCWNDHVNDTVTDAHRHKRISAQVELVESVVADDRSRVIAYLVANDVDPAVIDGVRNLRW